MNMPASTPGTYLLLLECGQKMSLTVGRSGELVTGCGYYLYVGSAFGPGGVGARVAHHSRVARRPHWHIDYLRSVADLVAVWCRFNARLEHEWAHKLICNDTLSVPLEGFGSSDCGCRTHLFFSKRRPVISRLERALGIGLHPVDPAGL